MYFKTGHGFAINAWDALFHWPLLVALSLEESPHMAGLWCGSILNSMPVFLFAVLTCWWESASHAIWLNVPYVVAPALYLRSHLVARNAPRVTLRLVSSRLLMAALIMLHVVRVAHCAPGMEWLSHLHHVDALRLPCMVEQGGFAFWQGMVYLCVHAPLMVYFIEARSVPSVLLYAWCGASLQGQVSFMVSSMWQPARYGLVAHPLPSPWWLWMMVNAAVAIVPLVVIVWGVKPKPKRE